MGIQEAAISESVPLNDTKGGKLKRFSLKTQTTVVKALEYDTISQECKDVTPSTMVETLKTPAEEEFKICKIIEGLPTKRRGSIDAELILRKRAKSLRKK